MAGVAYSGAGSSGGSSVDDADTVANSGEKIALLDAVSQGEQGQRLGRYVLAEKLGEGGMGTVFAAVDPGLNRRVAVKVVRAAVGRGATMETARAQLLKEGRALAKLSHPNVVPVYDVGPCGAGIFVAMELVDGQTLSGWSKRRERHWAEVVPVFIHAGRGLEAAHDAGLVHRDFKPANVMIGRDGRIRVMDFGLAEADNERGATAPDSLGGSVDRSATGERRASGNGGLVMGTPAYMSPEQHLGQELDARSDQYSFCVALYRCLFGRLPVQRRPDQTWGDAIVGSRTPSFPSRHPAPRRLRRALSRGLEPRPEDRWPSIGRLIEELERCLRRRPRRVLAAVAGLSVAAGFSALAGAAEEDGVCADPGAPMAEVYDLDRRAALASAFEASRAVGAAEAWQKVSSRLDDRALQWSEAMERTCDARAEGTLTGAQLDLRMTCLSDALDEFRAFVDVYSSGELAREGVGSSAKSAAGLPAPSACESADESSDPWKPPGATEANAIEVQAIRNGIRLSRALGDAGRYDESRDVALTALEDAEGLGHGPAVAEALYQLGNVELVRGDYEQSAQRLQRAYWLGREHDHAKVTSNAASDLIYVFGYHLARPEETDVWIRHAQAALDRWGRGGVDEALFLSNYGSVLEGVDVAAAGKQYERALEIYQEKRGPVSSEIAMLHNNVAAVLDEQGDFAAAREHYGKALQMWDTLVGPDHPDTAMSLLGLGVVQARQGEHDAALETLNRAERIYDESLGPDHVHVAMVLISRSTVERHLGDEDASIASLRRAKQIYLERVGRDHPYVAATSINLGQTLSARGKHEEALAEYREAIRVNRQTRGDEHPHMAGTLSNMGTTFLRMDRPQEALERFEQSLAMFEKTLGADHQDLHFALVGIGNAKRRLGQPADAVEPLRRAIGLLEGKGADPRFIVTARLTLAEALLELDPPRRGEALSLCRRALEEVGGDPTLAATRTSVEAFLAEHE